MTEADSSETMADVDHTHPHTDEPFGEPYRRSAVAPETAEMDHGADAADGDPLQVRTDGGERIDSSERTDRDERTDGGERTDRDGPTDRDGRIDRDERPAETMAEVDHAGTADVSGAFERGRVRDGDSE